MRIALVHLIRRQNPPEAFHAFWRSYREHPAGFDHDVILAWKNYRGVPLPEVPGGDDVRHVVLSDRGCDIDVYFHIAETHEYDAFVFFNSWSRIRKEGWLAAMQSALTTVTDATPLKETMRSTKGTALVGAFSSTESHRENIQRKFREAWRGGSLSAKVFSVGKFAWRWVRYGARTPPRPNFHVRTNAFLIRRDVLLRVGKPWILDKMDAFRFESGYKGLTRQVRALGYEAVALDALGLVSDNRVPAPGPASGTLAS